MLIESDYTINSIKKACDRDPIDDEVLFESTQYAMELDQRNPIKEGILERFVALGASFGVDDNKAISDELLRRFKSMGVKDKKKLDAIRKFFENRMVGKPVSYDREDRKNLYDTCLALEMNAEEAEEFFHKKYMTVAFNCKDRLDAVYYYGFLNQKTYLEIQELLTKAETIQKTCADQERRTREILYDIENIRDDDVFLEYLKTHTYDKNQQYQTATNEIYELYKKASQIAVIDWNLNPENDGEKKPRFMCDEKAKEPKRISALLSYIYTYTAGGERESYEIIKKRIAKCENLPKRFRENFTENMRFTQIKNNTATPDTYRKALIVLNFFHYFCSSKLFFLYGTTHPAEGSKMRKRLDDYYDREKKDIKEEFDEFKTETSRLLEKCGLCPVYGRNPFDWMMLFCAWSINPLDCFREVLYVRTCEDDEE